MTLIVVDLHTELSSWKSVQPFLYGHIQTEKILVCSLNRRGRFFKELVTDSRNEVRRLLFAHNVDHFSLLIMLRIPDGKTSFKERITEQVALIERRLVKSLADQGFYPNHQFILLIDQNEKSDHYDHPTDITTQINWQLDAQGYLNQSSMLHQNYPPQGKRDIPEFTETDLDEIDQIWRWPEGHFSKTILDKELPENLKKEIRTKAKLIEAKLDEIITSFNFGNSTVTQNQMIGSAKHQQMQQQQWDTLLQRFYDEFSTACLRNNEIVRNDLPRSILENILLEEKTIHGFKDSFFFRIEIKTKPPVQHMQGYLALVFFINTLTHLLQDNGITKLSQKKRRPVFVVTSEIARDALEDMLYLYNQNLSNALHELETIRNMSDKVKIELSVPTIQTAGKTNHDSHLSLLKELNHFFLKYNDRIEWHNWQTTLEEELDKAYDNLKVHLDTFLDEISRDKKDHIAEGKINEILAECKRSYVKEYEALGKHRVPILEPVNWQHIKKPFTRKALALLFSKPKFDEFFAVTAASFVIFSLPLILYLLHFLIARNPIADYGILSKWFMTASLIATALAGVIPVFLTNRKLKRHIKDTFDEANRKLRRMIDNCQKNKEYLVQLNKVECSKDNLNRAEALNLEVESKKLKQQIHENELIRHREKCQSWLNALAIKFTDRSEFDDYELKLDVDWHRATNRNIIYQPNPDVEEPQRKTSIEVNINGAVMTVNTPILKGLQRINFTEDPMYTGGINHV